MRVVALLLVVTVRKGWFVLFRVGLLDRFYCNNLLYNLSRNGDGKKYGRERMADCAIDLAELGLSLCCRRHPCKGCRFPVNGHACRALLLYAEPPSGRIRWRPCV